jgi:hypothetical protein
MQIFSPLLLERTKCWSIHRGAMANKNEVKELSWPWWAPWALLAVAATSLLTIGATLYDIL